MAMLDYVLDRLNSCPQTYREIAEATGVKYDWLCRLAQRRIPEPGVSKIQALFDYFQSLEQAA